MSEQVGIQLRGGPYEHTNVYSLGWPPPERLVAFRVAGQVAIADAEHHEEARDLDADATVYRKVAQSKLPDAPTTPVLVRGAQYEAEQ